MKCPRCGGETTKVVRSQAYDTCRVRVRVCPSCGYAAGSTEEWDKGEEKPALDEGRPVGA